MFNEAAPPAAGWIRPAAQKPLLFFYSLLQRLVYIIKIPQLCLVSDWLFSNSNLSWQATKRFRYRRNRLMRRLLDEAFQLHIHSAPGNNESLNALNSLASSELSVPIPQPAHSLFPPLNQFSFSTFPYIPVPTLPTPYWPRIRPDSPPITPSISPPSYSPIPKTHLVQLPLQIPPLRAWNLSTKFLFLPFDPDFIIMILINPWIC